MLKRRKYPVCRPCWPAARNSGLEDDELIKHLRGLS
jgi:hypothetical protein